MFLSSHVLSPPKSPIQDYRPETHPKLLFFPVLLFFLVTNKNTDLLKKTSIHFTSRFSMSETIPEELQTLQKDYHTTIHGVYPSPQELIWDIITSNIQPQQRNIESSRTGKPRRQGAEPLLLPLSYLSGPLKIYFKMMGSPKHEQLRNLAFIWPHNYLAVTICKKKKQLCITYLHKDTHKCLN